MKRRERQSLINLLEGITDCDVYILFTATGSQYYSVSTDFLPIFTEAIFKRKDERRKNAIIVFETNGGDPTAAMAVIKQLRENYEKIYGYAFNRCFSAGTVAMFASDQIFMSRYALLTPIDIQYYVPDEAHYRPIIANFNAFVNRTPDNREKEFSDKYPGEYLSAITLTKYAIRTIYPNFEKHCKPSMRESTWEYFNGGAGLHSAKISRTEAIKDFGLKIQNMPDDVENLLYDIINSYIESTEMLRESIKMLEEKNAYFETSGLTYVHYAKYQAESSEVIKTNTESNTQGANGQRFSVDDKYCIEYGWKKEE